MTGYAVSERIRVFQVESPRARAPFADRLPEPMGPFLIGDDVSQRDGAHPDEGVLEELEGMSVWARLSDLRDDLATAWRQTTFFLFDPQSWR
jgi:hypothetical protein